MHGYQHRGASLALHIRFAVVVTEHGWFGCPVMDGMTDNEAFDEAAWAVPPETEQRRFIVSAKLDGAAP